MEQKGRKNNRMEDRPKRKELGPYESYMIKKFGPGSILSSYDSWTMEEFGSEYVLGGYERFMLEEFD